MRTLSGPGLSTTGGSIDAHWGSEGVRPEAQPIFLRSYHPGRYGTASNELVPVGWKMRLNASSWLIARLLEWGIA